MRKLRGRAAHSREFFIEPEEAERYIETAHNFYMTVQFVLTQAPKTPDDER